jgi:cephalosporin hydroxylase
MNILLSYARNPKGVAKGITKRFYNKIMKFKSKKIYEPSDIQEFNEIVEHSMNPNDISDHLISLFTESLSIKPKLIVELGVRGGDSTFVLERVAKLCKSKLISVDIENCSKISPWDQWIFVQKDDIEFAKEFVEWCKKRVIEPKIDILLIDTSHIFEHTVDEIKYWFPFLSDRTKVFFHDTNLNKVYYRKDGAMDFGWDNNRGVIRALEKYFDKNFNEKREFLSIRNGWLIKHYPFCNGFTIIEKLKLVNKNEKF